MSSDIKILLSIVIEGGTFTRKDSPEIIKYTITKRDMDPYKKWRGKDGLEIVKRIETKHYPLESKNAIKHININSEAYNYMKSPECPSFSKPKIWGKLSSKQRIELHMQHICEHFHGKSYFYDILDD